jgi:5'-3' exonuclease
MSIDSTFEDFLKFKESQISELKVDNKILIVDGLNLFIRNFQAVPIIDYQGDHVGGILGFFRTLHKAIVDYSPTSICVVFDGKGGSSRRRKLLKDYKHRVFNSSSFNRFDDTRGIINENESQRMQVNLLVDTLDIMPVRTIIMDNVEADDVIAYLCKQIYPKESSKIIISSDKDYLQLIDDKISVYSHEKKMLITESDMIPLYGYTPLNYLTYRCFTGDRTDNISGLKQVGQVGLNKHFKLDSADEHVTIDDIIDMSQELYDKSSKAKIFENILNQKDTLYRNYELMQLLEPNMSATARSNIMSIARSELPELDDTKLQNTFSNIGLCKNEYDFLFWKNYLKNLQK